MDRQLSLEFARITEQAALKSARLVGLGDKEGADQAAVDGMHEQFALTPVSGTVVIGEGEIDEAPMLYIGEHVGQGGEEVDIAVDPVEGTNLVAKGKNVSYEMLPYHRFGKGKYEMLGRTYPMGDVLLSEEIKTYIQKQNEKWRKKECQS